MSSIQVNTSDLYNGSKSLQSAADEIGSAQRQTSSASGLTGNAYDGQLRHAIESIVAGSGQVAIRLENRANDLAAELVSRANGFESANEAGKNAIHSSFSHFKGFVESSPLWRALLSLKGSDMASANFLWGIGGMSVGTIATCMMSSFKDARKLLSASYLSTHLGWSKLRPNSIIFHGPNWMRKALDIKKATRVIKPNTLAKGMAWFGLAESGLYAANTVYDDLSNPAYQSFSQKVAAAYTDGSFKFAISAVGTVGIPLILGAIVAAVGAAPIVAGAVVIGGTVGFGMAYDKAAEPWLWNVWEKSDLRKNIVDQRTQQLDSVTNIIRDVYTNTIKRTQEAFSGPIHSIITSQ